jgi:integrase
MSIILVHLQKVHDLVHDSQLNSCKTLLKKKDFSEPKIYTGGVNILLWSSLSEKEKKVALSKKWYVYYSFRDENTGYLKRMPNIKGIANSFKTKNERLAILIKIRDGLEFLLEKGFNPSKNNDIESLLFDKKPEPILIKEKVSISTEATILVENTQTENFTSIKDAFEHTLKLKKNMMSETSYGNYKLRIDKFFKFLPDETKSITSITKRDAVAFLNDVLEKTSPRNRNNYRTDLSSFFSELENNEYIAQNFISKINVLKSNPERNKTFSNLKQVDIYEYLAKNDTLLLLFIQFISYNFLRPVEVCRLKIKDIDLIEKKLHVRAKNKLVKTKIIPKILIDLLPDLSQMNPEHYLFTQNGFGMESKTKENNRRDYFSKRFYDVVKKKFELNQDFGLYSFRHTFITKLYRKLRETNSQQIAKSDLMLITGHTTITALEKYLRDIDAELPEDYSNLLE